MQTSSSEADQAEEKQKNKSDRVIATSAVRGSEKALETLYSKIGSLPKTQSDAFLASFFVNLDPRGIPSQDAEPAPTQATVSCAWISLQGIYAQADIPLGAFLDLWPNMWQWVCFFHQHRATEDDMEGNICLDLITFVARFNLHDEEIKKLLATPGFVFFVTRAWFCRLQDDEPDLGYGYPALVQLLFERKAGITKRVIRDMIEGAGGTLVDLVALVVSYINAILPGPTDFITPKEVYLLSPIVDFVTTVDDVLEGREMLHYRQALGSFGVTLLSFGVTRALCNMAYGCIHQNEMAGTLTLLRQTLILLIRILGDSKGYRFIGESLEHGLVHTIVSCATMRVEHPACTVFLEQILPTLMIYHGDVQRLDHAFDHAEPILHCEPFRNCALVDKWRVFASLARERLALVNQLGSLPYRRACDNVKIHEKAALKRCSGCLAFYYCSPQCQQVDWRDGGHRQVCTRASFHLGGGPYKELTVRERLFMRAVLAHDYEKHKWSTVYVQEVTFMAENPGVPHFTMFNYRYGAVKITVHDISATHVGSATWDSFHGPAAWAALSGAPEWINDAARSSKSDGGTHAIARFAPPPKEVPELANEIPNFVRGLKSSAKLRKNVVEWQVSRLYAVKISNMPAGHAVARAGGPRRFPAAEPAPVASDQR
ncbi:hypothetical protein B0H16DRAFT_1853537 [Mycena metata]|uniref:MYND-type domain-containing protein n=1 Tax=Mycena metata TaxID=1033252 RepID=A0AAD7NVU0_9AGAR|nr:hypothetical protein B0H16DRAFT_1853537 [Mycena metata]